MVWVVQEGVLDPLLCYQGFDFVVARSVPSQEGVPAYLVVYQLAMAQILCKTYVDNNTQKKPTEFCQKATL